MELTHHRGILMKGCLQVSEDDKVWNVSSRSYQLIENKEVEEGDVVDFIDINEIQRDATGVDKIANDWCIIVCPCCGNW